MDRESFLDVQNKLETRFQTIGQYQRCSDGSVIKVCFLLHNLCLRHNLTKIGNRLLSMLRINTGLHSAYAQKQVLFRFRFMQTHGERQEVLLKKYARTRESDLYLHRYSPQETEENGPGPIALLPTN